MTEQSPLILSVTNQSISNMHDTIKLYYAEQYAPGDSASLSSSRDEIHPGLEGNKVPHQLSADDGITALLLLCFFLVAYVLSKGKRFLLQQAKEFSFNKERGNLFDSSTATDVRFRISLLFQTCVLLGIFIFDYFYDHTPGLLNKYPPIAILGIYIGVCVSYYFVKWLLYSFLFWIFFDKAKTVVWIEAYSTILYYLGFSLFPLVLLMVYFNLSSNILIAIGLGLVIFAKILMFYKWLKLFFNNLYGLFCLILYFCALEIVPCLVLYQGLIQINNLLLIKL